LSNQALTKCQNLFLIFWNSYIKPIEIKL
jgi:hypothetical protein